MFDITTIYIVKKVRFKETLDLKLYFLSYKNIWNQIENKLSLQYLKTVTDH